MNPLRGIGLKVLSVMIFTLMAVCIKASAPHVPSGQAVFFRSFFAIPVILAWLMRAQKLRSGLETRHPLGHFWRGLVGTSAMGLGFTALGLLPLPEATALGYAAPLLTVIFAAMFLGEQVRVFRLIGGLRRAGRGGDRAPAEPHRDDRSRRGLGAAGAGRDGGARRCGLRGAGAGLRAQADPHRADRGHRLLLLGDRLGAGAGHPAVRLGAADRARGGAARRRGAPRRRRADAADRELPPRRDRGDRALRICLDAAGAGLRLPHLRRGADRRRC